MSIEHIAFPYPAGYEPTEQELRNYAIGEGQRWEYERLEQRRAADELTALTLLYSMPF